MNGRGTYGAGSSWGSRKGVAFSSWMMPIKLKHLFSWVNEFACYLENKKTDSFGISS
jgi:hypothetical protein